MTTVHGILSIERLDITGDILDVDGADISSIEQGLGSLTRDWPYDDFAPANLCGRITEIRKIRGLADCKTESDRGLLDIAGGKPFIRITAVLEGEHEADYVRLVEDKTLYFGSMGASYGREGAHLVKTAIRGSLLTLKPVDLGLRVYMGPGK